MLRIYGRLRFYLLALGPGLVTAFADNDAGGITTYSLAGAQFGFGLMWVLLVTAIALTVTQETGARLALATGQGLAGLIRERFGVRWTAFAVLTMLVANIGTRSPNSPASLPRSGSSAYRPISPRSWLRRSSSSSLRAAASAASSTPSWRSAPASP